MKSIIQNLFTAAVKKQNKLQNRLRFPGKEQTVNARQYTYVVCIKCLCKLALKLCLTMYE